jgi:hypothetical protein
MLSKFFNKELQDKTLQLFVPNSKRLGGLHLVGAFFSKKKCTPLKDLKKRYMVSLEKALGRRLFLLGRTWRNKKRLPKFNRTVLGACHT